MARLPTVHSTNPPPLRCPLPPCNYPLPLCVVCSLALHTGFPLKSYHYGRWCTLRGKPKKHIPEGTLKDFKKSLQDKVKDYTAPKNSSQRCCNSTSSHTYSRLLVCWKREVASHWLTYMRPSLYCGFPGLITVHTTLHVVHHITRGTPHNTGWVYRSWYLYNQKAEQTTLPTVRYICSSLRLELVIHD